MRTTVNPLEILLTPEQTAASLGVSKKTLSVWRCTGRVSLAYVKVGARVRYRRADVDAYIARRTVVPNDPAATWSAKND